MAPNPNSDRNPISFSARSQTMPPTASRMISTAYVDGKKGLFTWKNSGSSMTGYVPRDPEICKTSNTIAIAFTTYPYTDTREYRSRLHVKLIYKPIMTHQ